MKKAAGEMMRVGQTVTVPSAVTELAGRRALGNRKAVFWQRRPLTPLAVWPTTLVMVGIAIAFGLAGWHGTALVLLGAFLVGIALWRYTGVAECVVVYDEGLVYNVGPQRRSVRWDEARYSWRAAADLSILPRADALEATGAAEAPDLGGNDGRIFVRRVSGMDQLQQLVDYELQPRAFARGWEQLADGKQADYPPLAVTAAGIFVNPGQATVNVPWSAVHSYSHAGGVLVVNAYVQDPVKGRKATQWFRGLVADAAAADRLLGATDPAPTAPGAADAAGLMAEDLATEAVQVWRSSRQRQQRTVRHGAIFAAVLIGGAALTTIHLPRHGFGFADVCDGHAASHATAYSPGPGPHPVDFEGGSDGFGGLSDNAGVLDEEQPGWIPAKPADVQLVACVSETDVGSTDSCDYSGGTVLQLIAVKYSVTVYAASTGAVVAGPQEIHGDQGTCPESIVVTNGQAPPDIRATLSLSAVESVVDTVENPGNSSAG